MADTKHSQSDQLRRELELNRDIFSTEDSASDRIPLELKGKPLPRWLKGSWIRNGLGVFEMGDHRFTHPFDAFAKLHNWTFPGDGTVLYTSKMIQSKFYTESRRKGQVADYTLFDAVTPAKSKWKRMKSLMKGMDNTNITVHRYGPHVEGEYFAVGDMWQSYQFEPKTLDTIRKNDPNIPGGKPLVSKMLRLPFPSSSHALTEHGTTDMINFVCIVKMRSDDEIRLIRIKRNQERELISTIRIPTAPYMHSFALTKNHAIIFAHPIFMDTKKASEFAPLSQSFTWQPEKNMEVFVVHLKTGEQIKLTTRPVFVMHQANAYEKNEVLVIDTVTYDNIDVFQQRLAMDTIVDCENGQTSTLPKLRRYTIDLQKKEISEKIPEADDKTRIMDFPIINENHRCLPYKIVYGVLQYEERANQSGLCKKFLEDPTRDITWRRAFHHVSEPIFVPNPEGDAEDDGVLMTLAYDPEKKLSYIAVFEGQSMELQTEIQLPVRIPFTLHGQFFPDLV